MSEFINRAAQWCHRGEFEAHLDHRVVTLPKQGMFLGMFSLSGATEGTGPAIKYPTQILHTTQLGCDQFVHFAFLDEEGHHCAVSEVTFREGLWQELKEGTDVIDSRKITGGYFLDNGLLIPDPFNQLGQQIDFAMPEAAIRG